MHGIRAIRKDNMDVRAGDKHFAATRLSFANRGRLYRLRRIDSKPASIVSIEVEKEKRTWPSPCGPKTTPGTLATFARSSSNSVAERLFAPVAGGIGKRQKASHGRRAD